MTEHKTQTAELCKTLMSADELLELRKPCDLPEFQNVGQKGYMPNEDDDEHAQSLLANQKALLLHQRGAKIGDLIQAEWDETLQKSITKKLKGKFTQHMGHAANGQFTLCPEETIFLLESGSLELSHSGMPVSTEEAYCLVLKGKYAVEKYRVYSYLSRLGYIVVLHQENLHMIRSNKEKIEKRKRKVEKYYEPCKRVNLDSSQESNSKSCSQASLSVSSSAPLSFENAIEKELLTGNMEQSEAVIDGKESNCNAVETANDVPKDIAPKLPGVHETTDLEISESKQPNESDVLPVVAKDTSLKLPDDVENVNSEVSESKQPSDGADLAVVGSQQNLENAVVAAPDSQQRLQNGASEVTRQKTESTVSTTEKSQDVPENTAMESQERDDNVCSCFDENSILSDSQEILDHSVSRDRSNVIEVGSEVSNSCTVQDDSHLLEDLVTSSSSDEELVTINDSESVLGVDTNSLTCDAEIAHEDDDIVFVEVSTKEKEPLAVIDLLSDDEGDSGIREDSNQSRLESDDEIQIIAECTRSSSLSSAVQQKKKKAKRFRLKAHPKTETSNYPTPNINHEFNNSVQWNFPNLLRKTVVCLPRPPPHLLPMNVRLSKEAYTIDLRMITANNNTNTPRVWNSYRDLQERRRNNYRNGPNRNFSQFSNRDRPFSPNIPPPFNSHGQGTNYSQPFGGNMHPAANAFGSPVPFAVVKGEPRGNSSGSPLLPQPANFSDQRQLSEYIAHAQQTAMHVAQTVLNQMTMNLPFGVRIPNSLYPNPPRLPLMQPTPQNFSNSWENRYPVNQDGLHRMIDDARHIPSNSGSVSDPRFRGRNFENQNARDNCGFPFSNDSAASSGNQDTGNWRPMNEMEHPFPSNIPRLGIPASSWQEFKTALGDTSQASVEEDDIMEVPIDVDKVLWSKTISPLVKPGMQNLDDILKSLRITKPANLLTDRSLERHMAKTCSLEISFDVYLPGTVYKKSCPPVPNHRVVVVHASDPFPKTMDIIMLQRKFLDSAVLQFAVVDSGDVAFYSFSNVDIPMQL